MIKKQDLLQDMANENLHDEEVMEIFAKYPEELSDEDAKSLEEELENFATDSALLAKAYRELSDDFDENAQMVVDSLDSAVTKIAQTAYDDLGWANSQSDK